MNWVHPVTLLLAAVAVAFVESSFNGLRGVLNVQPDLMPSLIVYAALNASLTTTTVTAVLGGLAFDALSSGPMGITVIPLCVLGVLLHRRRDVLLRDSTWAQASMGGVASLAVAMASLALMFILWPLVSGGGSSAPFLPERRQGFLELPFPGPGVVWQWMVMTAAGAAATPVAFRVFRWVEATFHYQPMVQAPFRVDREIKRGRR